MDVASAQVATTNEAVAVAVAEARAADAARAEDALQALRVELLESRAAHVSTPMPRSINPERDNDEGFS